MAKEDVQMSISVGSKLNYEELRRGVRDIVDNVIKPRAEQTDSEGIFPRENLQALATSGWNGVLIPQQFE
ncbi:acyl-CoA dehydrogenase family protein [Alicyclobacillus pomorum]|uniref:acyl-CoA dehydrogenase family protein n=2 Tax=Alicyclobacillus pomorum TaxID=204470 RepID=UPI00316ACB8A